MLLKFSKKHKNVKNLPVKIRWGLLLLLILLLVAVGTTLVRSLANRQVSQATTEALIAARRSLRAATTSDRT